MTCSRKLTIFGTILIVLAWLSTMGIPKETHKEVMRLITDTGGNTSAVQQNYAPYSQIVANSRMLQNAYVGVAGLLLLAAGLASGCRKDTAA